MKSLFKLIDTKYFNIAWKDSDYGVLIDMAADRGGNVMTTFAELSEKLTQTLRRMHGRTAELSKVLYFFFVFIENVLELGDKDICDWKYDSKNENQKDINKQSKPFHPMPIVMKQQNQKKDNQGMIVVTVTMTMKQQNKNKKKIIKKVPKNHSEKNKKKHIKKENKKKWSKTMLKVEYYADSANDNTMNDNTINDNDEEKDKENEETENEETVVNQSNENVSVKMDIPDILNQLDIIHNVSINP